MKKIWLLIFLTCLFGVDVCYAATCSDKAVSDAAKVKVETIPVVGEDIYYQIKISNLTENIFVEVYEDDNETTTNYNYTDTLNGVLVIDHWYIYEKVNYTIKVFDLSTECLDVLNTIKVSTNKFNENYNYTVCEENPDYSKCDPFYEPKVVDEEKQDAQEFTQDLEKHYEKKNAGFFTKAWEVVKEYYLYVLIPFALFGIIYVILILIYKRRRSEVNK